MVMEPNPADVPSQETMTYFAETRHYILRWPPELFAQEVERLIRRGAEWGTHRDWVAEVEVLLQQAFESQVPAEHIREIPTVPACAKGLVNG